MHRSTFITSIAAGFIGGLVIAGLQLPALGHCEIPCGIYDDPARIHQMLEDTETIAKAVNEIRNLAGRHDALAINQATRWINNKEIHATKIQDTIAQYFLTQRIKPAARGSDGWDGYVNKLAEHHAVMVAAMKTKQDVDPATVDTLRRTIETIAVYYPGDGAHQHATTAPSGR